MGNDERPKLSWRDIDKRRDSKSSGARSNAAADLRPGSHEEHRQKQYRAALEAAFAKGELGKLADKLNISSPSNAPSFPVAAAEPAASESGSENSIPTDAAPADASANAAAKAGVAAAASPAKSGGRKKVEDEKLTLRRKLVEAAGRQEISRAAEKYLARYPLPDDHELLEQLLDHERESRAREAIGRIADLIERRQPPRRSRALCGKLRYIIETTSDSELRQAAQNLLNRLV
jgi:hypothetical protein